MILGTVQLGVSYGVNNKDGQPDHDEALKILETAYDSGIRMLDTAPAYGTSESLIGDFHRLRPEKRFRICTKLPPDLREDSAPSAARASIAASVAKLNVERLDCCYLHRFDHCRYKSLMCALREEKERGRIDATGVSIYHPDELSFICDSLRGAVDIVQIPLNIFSLSRWENALHAAAEADIRIFARSIFLQGLVFSKAGDEFAGKLGAEPYVAYVRNLSVLRGVSVAQLCYDAVRGVPEVRDILFGCETMRQLTADLEMEARYAPLSDAEQRNVREFMRNVPDIVLDPAQWDRLKQ